MMMCVRPLREPLLAPLAAVAGGVLTARFADFSTLDVGIAAALAGCAAVAGFWCERPLAGMAACLLGLFLTGAWLTDASTVPETCRVDIALERSAIDWDLPLRWTGWVRHPPRDLGDAEQVILEVEEVYGVPAACGAVQVTAGRRPEESPLEFDYGDRVEWLAPPRRIRNLGNPGTFDRVGWMQRQGVYLAASVKARVPWTKLPGRGGSRLEARLWDLREELRRRLDSLSARQGRRGSDAEAALQAMLLGDRQDLSPELKSSFQRSGAYHVLVVSGLHVGLLAGGVFWILRMAGLRREWGALAGLATAVSYAMLLEGAVPTGRAAWMLAFYTGGLLLYRGSRPLNVVAAVALGFLLFDPELLADAGFQLSFLAVGLIAGVAVPLLERTTQPWRTALLDPWNQEIDLHLPTEAAERRVLVRLWLEPLVALTPGPKWAGTALWAGGGRALLGAAAVVIVSTVLAIGLATPLAWHFQQVAGGGIVTNLAATPLLTVIVPAGISSLLLNSAWLFELAVRAAEALVAVAAWSAENLPLDLRTPPPPVWLAASTLAALCFWGWTLRRRPRMVAPAIAAVLVLTALTALHPFRARMEPGALELTAIDVGQGDALLLGLPDGSAGLIDAGGLLSYGGEAPAYDIGDAVVSPYLWSRSIQHLAFVAVTHPDADHLGGAAAVLRNFDVERLWLSAVPHPEYAGLEQLARERGVMVERLTPGEAREVGEALIETLWPPPTGDPARFNENSLTLLVRFGEHEFLLTGDLEEAGEAAVAGAIGVDGEVLKAAHHGSKTSSTSPLLESFRPELAVISAGVNNPFGHPHPDALARLREARALAFRTDRDGAVSILSDGRRLRVRRFRGP